MQTQNLILAIEAFAASRGLSPATVTGRAVGNSRLYQRMKRGGGCTLATAERLLGYLAPAAMGISDAENDNLNTPDPAPVESVCQREQTANVRGQA